MKECIETEPFKNKVYTDCSRYVQNLLEQDDDLWDVFHNNEPFTVKLLRCLLEKTYLASMWGKRPDLIPHNSPFSV